MAGAATDLHADPALKNAEFLRFGSIHRNAYIEAWRLLGPELELRARPHMQLAGQLTGVEGYIESTAIGLLAARFLAARLDGKKLEPPPVTTAFGGLYQHLLRPRDKGERFEPTNINFGLLPPVETRRKVGKRERRQLASERAGAAMQKWLGA